MRALGRVVATFVAAQGLASVAWACKCLGEAYDPVAVRDESDQVFVGEVLGGPRGGCGGADVVYTLRVTEAFKGVDEGEKVEITTAAEGSACGVELAEGESWLVYAVDGRYGLCDPGGLADENVDDLEALRGASE